MEPFYPFLRYMEGRPRDQYDLAELLHTLVLEIEKGNSYPDPLTLNEIQVRTVEKPEGLVLEFQIDAPKYRSLNNQSQEKMTETEKIRPFCEIILSFYKTKPKQSLESVYKKLQYDPEIVKEFKLMLKSFYSGCGVLNFKFFCKRLKEIYRLFGQINVFRIEVDNIYITVPRFDNYQSARNTTLNNRNKAELHICNYCASVSLEPIFVFKACECWFHKQCLEAAILLSIEAKELHSNFNLQRPCKDIANHLASNDLKVIVEIERERFTLSKRVVGLIRYYYLYWNERVEDLCKDNKDCNEHTRVSKITKRPTGLCNGICSFCGEKWKEGKECQKFLKAMSWV